MKKIILTLLLSIAILPINAQIHWGIKGGINYTNLSSHSKHQIGWHIGPMTEIHLPVKNLMIDAALLYQHTDYSTEFLDEEIKSIEIPVNLKYNLTSTEKVDFFVATGPQFLFLLDKSTNFASSWNFKGGIKCFKHVQLEVGYNIPLGRTFEVHMIGDNFTEKVKRKGWNVSAAYLF
jgi:hypothetical protein